MSTQTGNPVLKELPEGRLALLFTDVAGSTHGWETHGNAYGVSLRRHFQLIERAVTEAGGVVFKTVGDQVCAVFPNALDAVQSAISAQRSILREPWPEPAGPIRVRMALHCGTLLCRDGDYFGPPANRVARLLNAAHPGQVLLSEAARIDLPHSLTAFSVRSLGVHRLKDLLNPEPIFQVVAEGLDTDFPPPRTLDARPHNLPVQINSFVGRTTEMETLSDLLMKPANRLVTLLGPPGVGKTRLATQFAAEYAYRYPDGVWLVELAAVREPSAVAHQIESALGLKSVDNREPAERLLEYLSGKELLLVCDNFEHLLPAAQLLDSFIRNTKNIRILVTSRSVLRLSGETVLEVPPLPTPSPEFADTLPVLDECPSVALFIERGAAARPSWSPTESEAQDLAVICRELDGLPLAIELAAARLRSMSVQDIRMRLTDRFRLLSSANVDIPERQRTLSAALDWSYELLSPAERKALAQISVFRGSFSLDASEAVCGLRDVWDIIPTLHEHSFLAAREHGGAMRYHMLEVVREYAAGHLAGDSDVCRERHACFYLHVAENCVARFDTLLDAAACEHLEADLDNIRAAMSWYQDTGDAEMSARFAVAMAEYFNRRGLWSERLQRLKNALALGSVIGNDQPLFAWLQYHLANALADVGSLEEAEQSAQECLKKARSFTDTRLEAWSLILLGFVAEKREERTAAEEHYSEAEVVAKGAGDAFSLASALTNQARLADFAGETQRAVDLLEQSLSLWSQVGSARGQATALTNLGCIADEVEGCLADARGDHAAALQKRVEAIRLFQEALHLQMQLQNVPKIALLLNNIGEALERTGQPERALKLFTAAETLFRRTGSPKADYVQEQIQRVMEKIGRPRAQVLMAQYQAENPLDIAGQTARAASDGPNGMTRDMIMTDSQG